MRCGCSALLAGVDLVRKGMASAPLDSSQTTPSLPQAVTCPYQDCGQSNPPGSATCLYCNRALADNAALSPGGRAHSLLGLPAALKDRFSILRPLPTHGAEAELLVVQAHGGGPERIAKVYRHGIQPRREVQERIARIHPRHRVEVLESGSSEGYAYELLEYCTHGSLRERLDSGPLDSAQLHVVVRELAAAIAGVHAAGLVHRDLKPENVLVRAEQPLVLVLTDFGIASVLDATQRFTSTARTLPYASPESLSGVMDGKADYWALGMITLEAARPAGTGQ